ncbi:MAG: hypothetical protein HRT68_06125, partial [Flavobacteriaceae bacterium]|nr:hypothetical protein [Flavobacteriaceae bacterium]
LKFAERKKKFQHPNFGGIPNQDVKHLTPIQRKYNEASSGILNLFINSINGKLKELREMLKIEEALLLIDEIDMLYEEEVFIKDCGIEEARIADFLYFCSDDERFVGLAKNTEKLTLT